MNSSESYIYYSESEGGGIWQDASFVVTVFLN